MKTDTYTKIVLTIIAIALSANFLKGLITPAQAADNKKYAVVPVNADGSIKVKLEKGETMDVNIVGAANYVLEDAGPIRVQTDN